MTVKFSLKKWAFLLGFSFSGATFAATNTALPNVELTGQLLYQIMASEIALQRNEPALAYQTYMQMARSTKDPRLAQRAFQIADAVHAFADAQKAGELWTELAPGNADAQLADLLAAIRTGQMTPEIRKEAEKIIDEKEFSLYILDLTLPDGSGYDVCKKIKAKGDLPVIFLTAYDDEVNVIMGFELGADDYISKPFRVKELMLRIKSVMRRYSNETSDGIIKINNLKINTNEAKVYKNNEEIILTAMEYRLLLILLSNRGKVLSRTALLENIWDVAGDFVEDNTLTVYIKRLRDKIEEDPAKPEFIKTVRGLGYVIEK